MSVERCRPIVIISADLASDFCRQTLCHGIMQLYRILWLSRLRVNDRGAKSDVCHAVRSVLHVHLHIRLNCENISCSSELSVNTEVWESRQIEIKIWTQIDRDFAMVRPVLRVELQKVQLRPRLKTVNSWRRCIKSCS